MTRCAYVYNVDTCGADEPSHRNERAHDFVRPEDSDEARIEHLERQVTDLQAANTREVERRRHAEGKCACSGETLCDWARGKA